jgi:hypothetical protein
VNGQTLARNISRGLQANGKVFAKAAPPKPPSQVQRRFVHNRITFSPVWLRPLGFAPGSVDLGRAEHLSGKLCEAAKGAAVLCCLPASLLLLASLLSPVADRASDLAAEASTGSIR